MLPNQNQQTEYNSEVDNNVPLRTLRKAIALFLFFIIMPIMVFSTVLSSLAGIGLTGSLLTGLSTFAVGVFWMWVVSVIHQFLMEGAKRQVIFSFLVILLAFFVLFILSLFLPSLDPKSFIDMPFWAVGLLFSIILSPLFP